MGIFSKNNKDEEVKREAEILKELSNHPEQSVIRTSYKLAKICEEPENAIMKPISLYFDCVEMMLANKSNYALSSFYNNIEYAEKIYKQVFVYDEETPDFDNIALVFVEMFDENGAIPRKCFNETFFNLFNNKHNYIKWVKSLLPSDKILAIERYYVSYATEARSYYSNEDMFTANVINVTRRLIDSAEPQITLDQEIKNLEHMVGIYNVDENLILTAEQNIIAAQQLVEKSRGILEIVDSRINTIDNLSRNTINNIKIFSDAEVTKAKADLENINDKLNRAYTEFLDNQKTLITYDRQQLIKEVFFDAEQKLNELKQMAQMAVSSANLELMRINQESGNMVSKLDSYVKDDANIKKLLSDADANKELMSKLEKLMIINDQNIDQISKTMASNAGIDNSATSNNGIENTVNTISVTSTGNTINPVVGQDANIDVEEETMSVVSPLLDETISFKDRFDRVMEMKAKLEAEGEHFHKMFDDVIIAVMENSNPYLIGPSGCGKTYMVSQIARLLKLDFIDIGYINEEYDILGFQTANGGYSKPNFYRCYKYGKMAFCDELDNGNSRATVKLNSFLSNTEDASYNFPNGENVKRHDNFRVIAAGNTAGNGADSNYNTREKIEESVQQRFTPIYVGYDNKVEEAILGGNRDWYEFVVLFRQATDAWGKNNYGGAPGIITTRDVTRIKKYLDHQSFSEEKIIDYEFIQTKDASYLAFLDAYIRDNIGSNSIADHIYQIFSKKVMAVRNGEVDR